MSCTIRPFAEEDFPRVVEMRQEAFRAPVRHGAWLRGGGRVLTQHGRIIATTLVDSLGQFFGGRAIPSAAVSAVVVDPRYRGRGLGSHLLHSVLAEQRAAGLPLAVLYPSLVGIYRRAGFEFAGAHIRYRLPVRSTPGAGDIGRLVAWDDSHLEEVDAGYGRAAARSAGQLARTPGWWQERLLHRVEDQPVYRYLLRDAAGVAGHIVYTQQLITGPEGYAYDLQVRDLSWSTFDAARTLLAFVGANQPMGRDALWSGPVDEPLLTLFDGLAPRAEWQFAWMLRLLDVPLALESRGYPPDLATTVHVQVDDAILPENAGTYALTLADGNGAVERVNRSAPALDAGALAALYSGWTSATTFADLGRLTGASDTELARLDLVFGGPKPWMAEVI